MNLTPDVQSDVVQAISLLAAAIIGAWGGYKATHALAEKERVRRRTALATALHIENWMHLWDLQHLVTDQIWSAPNFSGEFHQRFVEDPAIFSADTVLLLVLTRQRLNELRETATKAMKHRLSGTAHPDVELTPGAAITRQLRVSAVQAIPLQFRVLDALVREGAKLQGDVEGIGEYLLRIEQEAAKGYLDAIPATDEPFMTEEELESFKKNIPHVRRDSLANRSFVDRLKQTLLRKRSDP